MKSLFGQVLKEGHLVSQELKTYKSKDMFTKYFEYIIQIFILLLFYALYGHIFYTANYLVYEDNH